MKTCDQCGRQFMEEFEGSYKIIKTGMTLCEVCGSDDNQVPVKRHRKHHHKEESDGAI